MTAWGRGERIQYADAQVKLLSAIVPGILQAFDLPDCYRELERKKLRQLDPVSALGVPA